MENQSDFVKITPEQWKTLLQKELKNASVESLNWKAAEGVIAQPAYFDKAHSGSIVCIPENRPAEGWKISEKIAVQTLLDANTQALNLLMNGVNELIFEGRIAHSEDFKPLLNNIALPYVSIFIQPNGAAANLTDSFSEYVKSQKIDPASVNGGINFDPIATALTRGNWVQNEQRDFEACAQMISTCINAQLTNFKPLCTNAAVYHLAGAGAVEELAGALAHTNEYITFLTHNGISAKDAFRHMHLKFAVGRGFYTQLCKIRAIRPLWANLMHAHGVNPAKAAEMHISCETSLFEQSLADEHNNLLRATTQAMSAVLGGCNSLLVHPFDSASGGSSDFSQRIARNIQLVLNEEAFLSQPADAASGSYLFEALTQQIMEKAWLRFQQIEAAGGLLNEIKNGSIQHRIQVQAEEVQQQITAKQLTYVGINKYPAPNSSPTEITEKEPVMETKQIKPLQFIRATAAFENQHLQTT